VPEGTLADGLTAIQQRYPEIDIGSYPKFVDGRGITTLVCRGDDPAALAAAADEIHALIAELSGSIMDEFAE